MGLSKKALQTSNIDKARILARTRPKQVLCGSAARRENPDQPQPLATHRHFTVCAPLRPFIKFIRTLFIGTSVVVFSGAHSGVLTRLYFENESQRVKGKRSIPSANIKLHTEAVCISRRGRGGPKSGEGRGWSPAVGAPRVQSREPIRTLFRRQVAANPYTVCLQRDRPP